MKRCKDYNCVISISDPPLPNRIGVIKANIADVKTEMVGEDNAE